MGRPIQILSLSLLLAFVSAATAQTSPACGIVDVDGPTQVDQGEPLLFKVRTSMIHTTKPEFKWTLSVGTITTGQGTDQIAVETVGLGGLEVTVTVELSGAVAGCKASASKSVQVKPPTPIGCALDSYGDIKFEDEQARLDNFAIQLENEPLSSGYILMSAGRETFEREAEERLDRAKSYLVEVRGIDRSRIGTVDCGFAEMLTARLWMVPQGATPPVCDDGRTIPPSEVKFTKRRP